MVQVASHWIHQKFADNLINASHSRDLSEAAREWQYQGAFDFDWFLRIGKAQNSQSEDLRCQFCNTRMKNYVILGNKKNGNRLLIGNDCYDKLETFLANGKIESALPQRKTYVKEARAYWKKVVIDKTFLGWFEIQNSESKLPEAIAELFLLVQRLGYAPTTQQADEIVEYYKFTRTFCPQVLLSHSFLDFSHKNLIKGDITIAQSERLKLLIDADAKLHRQFAANRRADENWRYYKQDLTRICERVNSDIKAARLHNIEVDEKQAAIFADITQRIKQLPELRPRDFPQDRAYKKLRNSLEGWKIWADPLGKPQEKVILLPPDPGQVPPFGHRRYLRNELGRWKSHRFVAEKLPEQTEPTMFLARVYWVECNLRMRLDSEVPADFPEIDFFTKSRNYPGEFVGKFRDKIVLPQRKITKPGKYRVFLMNDQGTYYRAWVF